MEIYIRENGHFAAAWFNYIKLIKNFPDSEKSMRGLFRRGIGIAKDNKA